MAFKIAIASGKGGTGKTTVAIYLYHFIKQNITPNIQLVDCDVEEPNDAIFFPISSVSKSTTAKQLIPEIDNQACTYCKKCVEYCEFNAITIIPSAKFTKIDPDSCHSCGACLVACQNNAIIEKPISIGKIQHYNNCASNGLLEGKLKIGSAMQTLLISQVKENVFEDNTITLYDAPPGTSCPVVETIIDANYVILVTEPTPFGLHDLKLTVELVKKLNKPMGVIINKAELGNNDIYAYLKKETIELLAEIPFNKAYASTYANGDLLKNIPEKISFCFNTITESIKLKLQQNNERNYSIKW